MRLATILIGGVTCLAVLLMLSGTSASASTAATPPTTATRAATLAPAGGPASHVRDLAPIALRCAALAGDIDSPSTLTVADYSLPSTAPRQRLSDRDSV